MDIENLDLRVEKRMGSARRTLIKNKNSNEDSFSSAKPLTEFENDNGVSEGGNTVYDLLTVYKSVTDQSIFEDVMSGMYTPDKNAIQKQKCNLHNIARNLQKIFDVLKIIDRKNVIVALGNTGCGKSTLLNSLITGPESLQLISISETLQNGSIKKRQVIELR